MRRWRLGDTEVLSTGGGLFLRYREQGLVLDTPLGVVAALRAELGRVRAVCLTGGRIEATGGLVPLLCALRRREPLTLMVPMGEERGVALAEAWQRGWGSPYPLVIDAARGGLVSDVGDLAVQLTEIRAGEVTAQGVRRRVQLAVQVQTADAVVSWVPGAAPSTALARLCNGVDLAVVEVGVAPWPAQERPWRLSTSEALRVGAGAQELWVVGDDGRDLTATFQA